MGWLIVAWVLASGLFMVGWSTLWAPARRARDEDEDEARRRHPSSWDDGSPW